MGRVVFETDREDEAHEHITMLRAAGTSAWIELVIHAPAPPGALGVASMIWRVVREGHEHGPRRGIVLVEASG